MIARRLAEMCLSLTGTKVGPKKYFSMALKAAWKYFKLLNNYDGDSFTIIGKFEQTETGGLKIFLPVTQEDSPDLKWFEIEFKSLEEAMTQQYTLEEGETVEDYPECWQYRDHGLNPKVVDDYSDVDNPEGVCEFYFFSYAIRNLVWHEYLEVMKDKLVWKTIVGNMVRVFLRYKCGLHFDIPLREMPRLLPSRIPA